jgi:hypothetical protein
MSIFIPLSLLGNGPVKTLPRQKYTRKIRRNVGRVVLYAIRVISWKKPLDFLTTLYYVSTPHKQTFLLISSQHVSVQVRHHQANGDGHIWTETCCQMTD